MKARHSYLIGSALLTLMLAGCGGSSSPASSTTTPGTGTGTGTTTPTVIDTFTQYVLNLFGAADTTEPQSIDAAVVTAPEATEPVSVN